MASRPTFADCFAATLVLAKLILAVAQQRRGRAFDGGQFRHDIGQLTMASILISLPATPGYNPMTGGPPPYNPTNNAAIGGPAVRGVGLAGYLFPQPAQTISVNTANYTGPNGVVNLPATPQGVIVPPPPPTPVSKPTPAPATPPKWPSWFPWHPLPNLPPPVPSGGWLPEPTVQAVVALQNASFASGAATAASSFNTI